MGHLLTGKLRFLYLLVLLQVVGGPLVLLQVTLFCKLTLHEAPRMGVAKAAGAAWHSEDFQLALQADIPRRDKRLSEEKNGGPKPKPLPHPEKAGQVALPWKCAGALYAVPHSRVEVITGRELRPQFWPNAPPGPPPRLG